jgi:hypothetical protein
LSLDAFGEPLHSFPAFTASVCNLNPTSRGSVRIKSPRFQDAPAIAPNYLSTDEDRKVAADSLRVTRRIASQPALARYKPEEWKPGVQYQSDEDLARLAGDIATTIFHPVGTTKMGADGDPMAVLDSKLRVRGVERQYQQSYLDDGREGRGVDTGSERLRHSFGGRSCFRGSCSWRCCSGRVHRSPGTPLRECPPACGLLLLPGLLAQSSTDSGWLFCQAVLPARH